MFAEFQGATNFNVSMLNKKTALKMVVWANSWNNSGTLPPNSREVVQGLSQDINMLSGDLFDVFGDELRHTVTNTPEHWLSLFNDNSHAKRISGQAMSRLRPMWRVLRVLFNTTFTADAATWKWISAISNTRMNERHFA